MATIQIRNVQIATAALANSNVAEAVPFVVAAWMALVLACMIFAN
jgi:hypothetical protein